jgi:hypothetical protein
MSWLSRIFARVLGQRRRAVANDTDYSAGDAEFAAGLGNQLLELAREWENIDRKRSNREMETHQAAVLQSVIGALALQLGIRAAALVSDQNMSSRDKLERLRGTQNDVLAQFVEAVSALAQGRFRS